jgi:hypothetical protein
MPAYGHTRNLPQMKYLLPCRGMIASHNEDRSPTGPGLSMEFRDGSTTTGQRLSQTA